MTLAEFLAMVKKLSKGATRNRISTADRFLVTLAKCSGGLCPTDRARYQGPEFEKRLKEAAATPVYQNDLMNFVGFNKAAGKKDGDTLTPVAEFDAIYTSAKQDRDNDVLHPEGGEVDPKMPVLWQHDPTAPIGVHREVLAQDKTKILGRSALADIPLGRDAAYLAEFGALRISHGFRPREFSPITEKSGGHEIVTGFDVTKYEMMEISLVSVPSNTDAVIQAFSRGKLASPVSKSWAKALDERRQRFYTTGFGVPALKPSKGVTVVGIKRAAPTGKVKALVARKDASDFEKSLAEACSKIVHSGDYGLCFYKAGDSDGSYQVWWTSGDADDPSQSDENGNAYTSGDDIKALLGAVAGVASVEVESETNPPFDEGWREVYPDVKDWTSDANKPEGDQSSNPSDGPATPPAADADKGGKGKKKDGTPVTGSAEHVAQALADKVGPYLSANGAPVEEGAEVVIQATYPDSVIARVGAEGDPATVYFRIGYTQDGDGNPTLSGNPEQVELQTVVSDAPADQGTGDGSTPPAGDTGGTGAGDGAPQPGTAASAKPTAKGKKTVTKWVPVKKGTKKLGKKNLDKLKEAQEHVNEAQKYEMPRVAKTCMKRAADLLGEVMKSDGTDSDSPADDITDQTPGMSATERGLWLLVVKAVRDGKSSNTARAALMQELASTLEKSDIDAVFAKMSNAK